MENIHSMPSNTWDIHSHHPWFQVEDFPYPGINTQSWVIGQSGQKTTSYDFHIPGLGCLGIQFYFGFALIEKKECWVVDLISKHDLMKKAIHCILPAVWVSVFFWILPYCLTPVSVHQNTSGFFFFFGNFSPKKTLCLEDIFPNKRKLIFHGLICT